MTLECFYDVSSPFTYICFHNLLKLSEDLGEPVLWRPIIVGGVFNLVNKGLYAERAELPPAKEAYMRKDIADWARHSGLVVRYPPTIFPINTVKAMRGCILLAPEGREVAFARACFEAYWRDDRDLTQDLVLADCAARAGADPARLITRVVEQDLKDALRANTDELMARGGFGSPTVFVDDDMYFGNDRLPLVRAAVERRRARG